MGRPASEKPTELELQFLKILWQDSPQPVRQIREALAAAGRDIAHTSVITTLNTMVDKGYLSRVQEGKAYLFSPLMSQTEVSQQMLGDIVERVFDGSASAVMLSLFECSDIDDEELKALRRLLNQKTREKK